MSPPCTYFYPSTRPYPHFTEGFLLFTRPRTRPQPSGRPSVRGCELQKVLMVDS